MGGGGGSGYQCKMKVFAGIHFSFYTSQILKELNFILVEGINVL